MKRYLKVLSFFLTLACGWIGLGTAVADQTQLKIALITEKMPLSAACRG